MSNIKEYITLEDWLGLPEYVQQFILLWKHHTNREMSVTLSLAEVLSLHILINRSHYKETVPPDQHYNHVIQGGEFALSYDGDELIDIVMYEVQQGIKKRVTHYVPKN